MGLGLFSYLRKLRFTGFCHPLILIKSYFPFHGASVHIEYDMLAKIFSLIECPKSVKLELHIL